MKQIERIKQMEECMDRVSQSLTQLSVALDNYESTLPLLNKLDKYYGNDLWKQDFADDEAGHLPSTLKRGVLSEDGVWNLLNDNRNLIERMRALIGSI